MRSITIVVLLCALLVADAVQRIPVERRHKHKELLESNKRDVPLNVQIFELDYYVGIYIGSPYGNPSFLNVQFDTGSPMIGVPSTLCTTCHSNDVYNTTAAGGEMVSCAGNGACTGNGCEAVPCSCSAQHDCQYTISYGDGSGYEAYIVTDEVNIGGFAVNTSVGAIFTETSGFENAPVDGILGMDQLSTYFADLVSKTGVNDIFSLCMGSQGGQLVIGGTDEYLYEGGIEYTPYMSEEFYQVILDSIDMYDSEGVWLGELPIPGDINNDTGVIVDTGTTVMVIEQALFNSIQNLTLTYCDKYNWKGFCEKENNFFESGLHALTAEEISTLPYFEFSFYGGANVPVLPASYLQGFGGVYALGMVAQPDSGMILGDSFIRSAYVVFDRQSKMIGFGTPTSACDL